LQVCVQACLIYKLITGLARLIYKLVTGLVCLIYKFITGLACLICILITGLEAELKHQEQVSASHAAEVTVLKDAAAASEASHQALTEELHSAHEQLQHVQTQASQLTTEHERLQQACSEQTARCNQLEENLTGSSDSVSELQRQLQRETEALHAVQVELQGTVIYHAGIMSHCLAATWECLR